MSFFNINDFQPKAPAGTHLVALDNISYAESVSGIGQLHYTFKFLEEDYKPFVYKQTFGTKSDSQVSKVLKTFTQIFHALNSLDKFNKLVNRYDNYDSLNTNLKEFSNVLNQMIEKDVAPAQLECILVLKDLSFTKKDTPNGDTSEVSYAGIDYKDSTPFLRRK